MSETSPVRGLRTYRAASIVLIVFGTFHLLAVWGANFRPPRTGDDAALKKTLVEHQESMGPFRPSVWGGVQILNASYSVLLLQLGLANLLAAGPVAAAYKLRPLTVVNLVFTLLLLAIPVIFQFPPPAVFAAAAAALFAVSWWQQRSPTPT